MPAPRAPTLAAVLLGACLAAMPAEAALRGHGGPVRAIVEVAPGALVSAGFDTAVIRWSLADETAAAVLRFHAGPVAALAALPGGRIASAGEEGRIALWAPGAAAPERVLEGHAGPVAGLAASPDGKLLASASWDRTVRVWNLAEGREIHRFEGHQDNVNGVAFAPDGRAVLSAGYDATLRRWPLDGAAASAVTLAAPLNAVAVAPDGSAILAGADGHLHFVDATMAKSGDIEALATPVTSLALSPDGGRIAAAGLRGAVVLVDRESRAIATTLVGPGLPVWSLAFGHDGRVLYTGGADRLVRRWDATTGRPIDPVVPEPRETAESTERGAVVFRACRACHTLTPDDGNRAGPTLHGLYGRRIATAPGYAYSPALKDMDIVWTPETVAKLFEVGPATYTPGTKMPEQTISDPADRQALVDWLARVTRAN